MVDPEYFAQIKEPAFTVNVDKTMANAAGVRMLPDVDYVKYMINRKDKRLILKPCSEYDIRGFKWAREKDGRRYAAARTGRVFVMIICSIMGWDPDNRYKVIGRKIRAKGEEVLIFDLALAKCYEKTGNGKGKAGQGASIPAGWNGRFGPTYGEDRHSLQIDTFDGYTVFSVNDGKKNAVQEKALPDEVQGNSGSQETGGPVFPLEVSPGENGADHAGQALGDPGNDSTSGTGGDEPATSVDDPGDKGHTDGTAVPPQGTGAEGATYGQGRLPT